MAAPLATPRIIGGAPTLPLEYPFLLSLHRYGSHTCGATLLSSLFALTAAHCVTEDDGSDHGKTSASASLSVLIGESRLDFDPSNPSSECSGLVGVEEVIRHPNYSTTTLANDFALLKFAKPRPEGCMRGVPVLDDEPTVASPGTLAVVAGWGRTSPDSASTQVYPVQSYSVTVPVVSRANCSMAYGYNMPGVMMCAGVMEGGKDSCQGDSGGPLFIPSASPFCEPSTLIGVVSWGNGCAAPGFPGVYARVSAMRSWIVDHVGETSTRPPCPPAPPPLLSPPPRPPGLPVVDACACSPDGVSGGVSTGSVGCANWRGDETFYCYVVGPSVCPHANPAAAFPGAGVSYCSPPGEAWGECECTNDYLSNGVLTDSHIGCANPDKDPKGAWCYVENSTKCGDFTAASARYPGAAWAYCPLESLTTCKDDAAYADSFGGCNSWDGFACTTAELDYAGWTVPMREWLVYSCPQSCPDVVPELSLIHI